MSGGGAGVASGGSDERSATEQARDAKISAAVRSAHAGDPAVSPFALGVRTVGGQVTLSGTVTNYAARNQAYRLARQVDGVTAVINQINVTESR